MYWLQNLYIKERQVMKHTANLSGLNPWQYGLTMSVGYNTWNGYIYYGLNPIFDSISSTSAQSIDMNALKIGLIFYLL